MKTVIDVSYAQGKVDWDRAKYDIDGAILRVGYGSDMAPQDDNQWARNIAEVERLGIPFGVYLYSYAGSDAQIQSEINHCLRLIKGHNPVLGVFYDLEENSKGTIATRAAKEWCRQISAAGYKAGIYTFSSYYKTFMRGTYEAIKGALWWVAAFGSNSGVPERAHTPALGFELDAWQYTSRKHINGINGNVDCSEWYADFGAEPAAPEPAKPAPADDLLELVAGVMEGAYGTGDTRKANLGSRYDEVQAVVNHIFTASVATLATEVISGKYGTGDLRKRVLWTRYDAVQAEVNRRLR